MKKLIVLIAVIAMFVGCRKGKQTYTGTLKWYDSAIKSWNGIVNINGKDFKIKNDSCKFEYSITGTEINIRYSINLKDIKITDTLLNYIPTYLTKSEIFSNGRSITMQEVYFIPIKRKGDNYLTSKNSITEYKESYNLKWD